MIKPSKIIPGYTIQFGDSLVKVIKYLQRNEPYEDSYIQWKYNDGTIQNGQIKNFITQFNIQ